MRESEGRRDLDLLFEEKKAQIFPHRQLIKIYLTSPFEKNWLKCLFFHTSQLAVKNFITGIGWDVGKFPSFMLSSSCAFPRWND